MNKKFLSVMLLATFFLGSASLFTACSDDDTVYDDSSVTSQISSLTSQLATLQSALSEAQSTADAAASAAASASTAASKASSEAESAAAQAKADAIEEAIEQTKTLIEAAQSATDEDIAALSLLIKGIDSDLNEFSSSLSSVSEDVEANTTAVAALTVQMDAVEKYMEASTASKDSLAEVTANIEADLAALTTVVDGKCTMDEVESYIAQVLSGGIQVVYTKEEVDSLLKHITNQILDINASLLTLKTDKLTSLVFIPELYVNGIEATRYVYIDNYVYIGTGWSDQGMTVYGTSDKYSIGDKSVCEYSRSRTTSRVPSIASMHYHYNPSSAVLDGVTFDFDELNVESITRSEAAWSANVDSTTYKNGTLDVYYKIDDPKALVDPSSDADGEVPVMSLKATLANDTTVNSDYAAIVPVKRTLNYIAFTEDSHCQAPYNNQGSGDDLDLYLSADDAATLYTPSVEVQYNGGTQDLASLLCIHYVQADYGEITSYDCNGVYGGVMTIDELEAWGLTLKFDTISFCVGDNSTDQRYYCEVTEDGKFTPCYVDANGVSQPIKEGDTSGKSSIGRTPMILVTLVDADDNVLVWGYMRIEIVKEKQQTTINDTPVVVKSETLAFDCDTESVSISWSDISGKLYEAVNLSAEDFRDKYTADKTNTYILNASGEYVVSSLYGTVEQSGDETGGSSTTTVLTATVDDDQKAAIYACDGHTQTIYLKYSYNSSNVYVGFTITIADLPSVTLTGLVGSEWIDVKDGQELSDGDEAKMNVHSPTTGYTVTDFEYTLYLDQLFLGSKIVATLEGDNASLYDANEVGYTYSFASTQDKIGSYTLYVSTDSLSLYADASMDPQYLVAEITDEKTGAIRYADKPVAKEILNLYSHDSSTLAYAKIQVNVTYGSCRSLGYRTFILDFIRPIDIEAGEDAEFEDATANGSSVSMSNLISITDWRDKPVYNNSNKGGCYDGTVNLYEYYEFESITIDLDNTMYTSDENIKEYEDCKYTAKDASVDLSFTDVDGNVYNGSGSVSIKNASDLSSIRITQSNTGAITSEYYLFIPVKITYAWGTISYYVRATVNKTIGNSKAN